MKRNYEERKCAYREKLCGIPCYVIIRWEEINGRCNIALKKVLTCKLWFNSLKISSISWLKRDLEAFWSNFQCHEDVFDDLRAFKPQKNLQIPLPSTKTTFILTQKGKALKAIQFNRIPFKRKAIFLQYSIYFHYYDFPYKTEIIEKKSFIQEFFELERNHLRIGKLM